MTKIDPPTMPIPMHPAQWAPPATWLRRWLLGWTAFAALLLLLLTFAGGSHPKSDSKPWISPSCSQISNWGEIRYACRDSDSPSGFHFLDQRGEFVSY